jgi:hypothetical protein
MKMKIIDTGVDFIDDILSGSSGSGISTISLGVTQKLTMIGAGVTATAITSLVNGGIRFFTVTNRGGGYTSCTTSCNIFSTFWRSNWYWFSNID